MKRILLSLSVLCAVGTAYAEREVFAPTILAPVATGANGKLIFAVDTPFLTGGNIYAANHIGIGTTGSNMLQFFTNTTQRMQINSAGHVYIGNGEQSATPTNSQIGATNGLGTNINGANLSIYGGVSTGSGSGGALSFFTSPAGGSGTSLNNTRERMRIDSAGDVYIGNGPTAASPTAGTIRGTSGSGTNIAGAEVLVAPGQGTGTGAGGVFRVSTAPAGTSGSSLNGLVERVRVKQGGQVRFVPLAAAPTLDVENGDVYYNSTTNKLQVRAAGAWVDLH